MQKRRNIFWMNGVLLSTDLYILCQGALKLSGRLLVAQHLTKTLYDVVFSFNASHITQFEGIQ